MQSCRFIGGRHCLESEYCDGFALCGPLSLQPAATCHAGSLQRQIVHEAFGLGASILMIGYTKDLREHCRLASVKPVCGWRLAAQFPRPTRTVAASQDRRSAIAHSRRAAEYIRSVLPQAALRSDDIAIRLPHRWWPWNCAGNRSHTTGFTARSDSVSRRSSCIAGIMSIWRQASG